MVKKSTTLEASELQQIRSFYEQERIQLVAKLHHVDHIIAKLGGVVSGVVPVAIPDVTAVPAVSPEPAAAPKVKRGPGRPRKSEATVAPAKKAGRPKKRGPKSVWGNFILRRLRQCDRPLSYGELIRDAMVLNNLPQEKEKNAKSSVLNAAFRLRNTLGKVDTVGLPGKKEKFLVLTSWKSEDGSLKAPYQELFEALAVKPMDDRGRKPRRPSGPEQATDTAAAEPKEAQSAPKAPAKATAGASKAPRNKASQRAASKKKAAVKKG